MDKQVESIIKENFFNSFEEYLTQRDENSAAFEFPTVKKNPWILNAVLKEFLDVLDMFYSDYSIRICRTSGHPTIQVFMRLEEGLWKAR